MMAPPILQKFGSDNFKGDSLIYLLWDYYAIFKLPFIFKI